MRTDNVLWIDRSRATLSELGFRGVLLRTKTSGVGRRVKELHIFVSRLVSLTGGDWLKMGLDLYLEVSKNFPGVLFLCRPKLDGSGFTRRYLDATLLASWMKWTLGKLPETKKAGVTGCRRLVSNSFQTSGWLDGLGIQLVIACRVGAPP